MIDFNSLLTYVQRYAYKCTSGQKDNTKKKTIALFPLWSLKEQRGRHNSPVKLAWRRHILCVLSVIWPSYLIPLSYDSAAVAPVIPIWDLYNLIWCASGFGPRIFRLEVQHLNHWIILPLPNPQIHIVSARKAKWPPYFKMAAPSGT